MTTEPKPETPAQPTMLDRVLANKRALVYVLAIIVALLFGDDAAEAVRRELVEFTDKPTVVDVEVPSPPATPPQADGDEVPAPTPPPAPAPLAPNSPAPTPNTVISPAIPAAPTVAPSPDFKVAFEGPPSPHSGPFMVFVRVPSDAVVKPRHRLPSGAMQPPEIPLLDGRRLLVFLAPPNGEYVLGYLAQRPAPGLDPLDESEFRVQVGPVAPPVVQPPITIPPPVNPVEPLTPVAPTSVTYVYEKDDTAIPAGVLAGLNRLNRERKILATAYEQDTTDGTGDTPEQYKLAKAEALKVGLPALVVLWPDGRPPRVVKSNANAPMTEEQVWGAAL